MVNLTNYNTCDVISCKASIPRGENYMIEFADKYGNMSDKDVCLKCYNKIGKMFGWSAEEEEE